ncbi:MAG TPA: response regulator [Elusimicrobiota bacterium]|jgi:DNA-binding response OmpR family regulator|nr:response regulator [Elusimicrobiota bacterium]
MTEQRRKILVADDETSIREILSIQLARMGYEVVLAGDGVEAVAAYESSKPDLVLLDVMMPRLNGLNACQQIRTLEKKSGRRVPILFLTARDTTHDKTSAALAGGDEFVAKPVSLQELRERVEAALKKGKP